MLLRNAHWILLVVCLLLVYVFYSASDESPSGVANVGGGKTKKSASSSLETEIQRPTNEADGGSMFARLQALTPKFLPLISKFTMKYSSNNHLDGITQNSDKTDNKHGNKPISPLIMGKNHTRHKTIL